MIAELRIGVIGATGRGNYGHGMDTVWRDIPDCEIVVSPMLTRKGWTRQSDDWQRPGALPTTASCWTRELLADGAIGRVLEMRGRGKEDRQPECHVYQARMTVEMIAAVFESHRIGGPARLPLKNRGNPLEMLE